MNDLLIKKAVKKIALVQQVLATIVPQRDFSIYGIKCLGEFGKYYLTPKHMFTKNICFFDHRKQVLENLHQLEASWMAKTPDRLQKKLIYKNLKASVLSPAIVDIKERERLGVREYFINLYEVEKKFKDNPKFLLQIKILTGKSEEQVYQKIGNFGLRQEDRWGWTSDLHKNGSGKHFMMQVTLINQVK